MALLIWEIVLDIYGSYQNTNAVILMMNNSFTKSTTYKFLILCCIINTFSYLVKFITMTWLFIDSKAESCYYFALGFIFTEFSSVWSLFGISCLRFISIVKKKNFIKMDQFEDVLWKFMFPIFLAVSFALTHKLLKSAASEIQQVRK